MYSSIQETPLLQPQEKPEFEVPETLQQLEPLLPLPTSAESQKIYLKSKRQQTMHCWQILTFSLI